MTIGSARIQHPEIGRTASNIGSEVTKVQSTPESRDAQTLLKIPIYILQPGVYQCSEPSKMMPIICPDFTGKQQQATFPSASQSKTILTKNKPSELSVTPSKITNHHQEKITQQKAWSDPQQSKQSSPPAASSREKLAQEQSSAGTGRLLSVSAAHTHNHQPPSMISIIRRG